MSKLDAVEVLKDTGSIPERTNFAIPIDEARGMVRKAYPLGFTPSARTERLSAQDIVKACKGATVLVYSAIHPNQPFTPPPAPSATDPQPMGGRLENHPDYAWVEKRLDEVYRNAIAQAVLSSPQLRASCSVVIHVYPVRYRHR